MRILWKWTWARGQCEAWKTRIQTGDVHLRGRNCAMRKPAVSCVGRCGQKGNGNLLHATTMSREARMLSAGGASTSYLGRVLTETHERQHELRKK